MRKPFRLQALTLSYSAPRRNRCLGDKGFYVVTFLVKRPNDQKLHPRYRFVSRGVQTKGRIQGVPILVPLYG